jgi:DNA-binding CsgD family transcriptional regulator
LTANLAANSLCGVTDNRAIVIFGDVIASRAAGRQSSAWLRWLRSALDERYADDRLAPFGFTQGDELQGLLRLDADPLQAVLVAALQDDRKPMRWSIVVGEVEPGPGPATERTGPAFLLAREALERQKVSREGLVVIIGANDVDELLADVAPVLARLLDELTPRQRTIARALLIDGRRQAEVAEQLHVSRATVSVVAYRARVREVAALTRAIRVLIDRGLAVDIDRSGDTVAADDAPASARATQVAT